MVRLLTASRPIALLLLLTLLVSDSLPAQTTKPYKRELLVVTVGMGFPESHEGITGFWRPGISASLNFLVSVNRSLSLGIGVGATRLTFKNYVFFNRYPNVALQRRLVALLDLYLLGKYSFTPTRKLSPFGTVTIGATHVTPALYKEVVAGVRQIYYDIPAKTRFAVGGSVGADLSVTARLWLTAEVRLNAVYNDPDVGLTLMARVGCQLRL